MRTNLSKKQRNEKVRQMVRELAYFSAIGKKISRKELSLKYHIGNGVFTIAQRLGYIKKIRSGIYSVMVDFTDKIIDELYSAHAANTKESTEKKKTIEPHKTPVLEFPVTYFPDNSTATGLDVANEYAECQYSDDNDYLNELRPFDKSELISGIFERLAEEFINLSQLFSK